MTSRLADAAYTWVSTVPEVIENKLEFPQSRMLFKNGYFDIFSEKRVEIKTNDFVTVRINAKFKLHKRYDTPCWDLFVDQCSGRRRDIKILIMTFLGYLLLPGAPAKNFFVLGTAPDSGKSLLAEFIRRLVSEDAVCAIAIDDLKNDFVRSQIVNKSINLAMDIPGGVVSRKSVSELKMLTGRDLMTINPKGEQPYAYRNFAKFVFATNEMVTIRENDAAFWNRMVIIPFMNSVPEENQDPDLLDKLWEERDGIVNEAIRYAKELIENKYRFPDCATAEVMKTNWISGRCPGLSSFVKNFCEFNDSVWSPTADLHSVYSQWCLDKGIEPTNEIVFSNTLHNAYKLKSVRHSVNGSQYRGLSGITLKDR